MQGYRARRGKGRGWVPGRTVHIGVGGVSTSSVCSCHAAASDAEASSAATEAAMPRAAAAAAAASEVEPSSANAPWFCILPL